MAGFYSCFAERVMWVPMMLWRDISVYFQQVYSSRQLIVIKRIEKNANILHSFIVIIYTEHGIHRFPTMCSEINLIFSSYGFPVKNENTP